MSREALVLPVPSWPQGRRWGFCVAALVILWEAGCGPTSEQTTNCATEARAESYSAGMEKLGAQNALKVRLIESMPGPPQKGDNVWRLQISDGAGTAISGASVTIVPFMPDHKHGTSVKAVVKDQGGGEYSVAPVNLFMPGLWETTINVQTSGGAKDKAIFSFCVDG